MSIVPYKPGLIERMFRSDSNLRNPEQWLIDLFTGGKSLTGEIVNQRTAMGLSVYFACIRNISEDVGKLPRFVYEDDGDKGRSKAVDHPAYQVVHGSPNELMSPMVFEETLTAHALGYKGGYAEIVRNAAGVVRGLYPLDPNTVVEQIAVDHSAIRYVVTVPGMQPVALEADDVLHIHGLGFDGLTGYAMTCIAKETIGRALATQNYGSRWFGNGAQPSGVLEVPAGFSPKAMENLRTSFAERHEGAANKGRTLLLEDGVKWHSVSVDAEKAQLIESMEFDVEDICRRFRMPPQKVGHLKRAQGWSTVEQFNTDYVVDCLMSWLIRWEQEYNRKLFLPRERGRLYVKHSVAGLLRGDSAARASLYAALFNIGSLSSNDIRELEEMNPVDGGDTYYVQGAMVPVDLQRRKMEAEIEALENPPEPENTPQQDPQETPETPQESARIGRISDAFLMMLSRRIESIIKREVAQEKRAAKEGESYWLEEREHFIGEVGYVLAAFGAAVALDRDASILMHSAAANFADRHVENKPRDPLAAPEIAKGIIDNALCLLTRAEGTA